ncbi:hypothetical protein EV363DRAFT_1580062 [Boletus edulis]|nr:hypothetical protein EV363DRAFT_1580062 [Boletus edulis]
MAKSLRSKSKRSFRAKKRESGKYAAAEAARLNRLNTKLAAVKDKVLALPEAAEEVMVTEDQDPVWSIDNLETMSVDGLDRAEERLVAVSTHGPRGSRQEEWRKSKGIPIPKRRGMNRQGGLAARRKAGRPSRRR